jgi:Galactose oxidase, central domain
MNPHGTFDLDLERWLAAEAPARAPAGLHAENIERARTMRQRPSWLISLRGDAFPGTVAWWIAWPAVPAARLLLLLGLVLALVAGAIFSGTLRPHPVRLPTWAATGAMTTPRSGATATLLRDGKVLVAGGSAEDSSGPALAAELYDPKSATWTVTGRMTSPRQALNPGQGATATLLRDGSVLVTGGTDANGACTSAELYDPTSGTWAVTGSRVNQTCNFAATLLPDGRVLVAGGDHSVFPFGGQDSAELYDPQSGTWTATRSMTATRGSGVTATPMSDGRVLVAGGGGATSSGPSAELFDPGSGTWSRTGSPDSHDGTATLLLDGRVLLVGGDGSSQLYDPASGTWTTTGRMTTGVAIGATATLLLDGRVLLVGGGGGGAPPVDSAELYDPASGTWTATSSVPAPRVGHTATLLPDGRVLVAGGYTGGGSAPSAELYDPGTEK